MSSVTVVALTLALVCLWARESSCSGAMYGAKAAPKPHDESKPDKRVGIYPTTPNAGKDCSSSESEEHHAPSDDHYGHSSRKFHDCYYGHLPLSLCVQLPADVPMKFSKHVMQQMVNSLMRNSHVHHDEVPCKTPKKPSHGKPCHHSHESGETKVNGELKKPCPKDPYQQPPCKVCRETHEHKPHDYKKYSHPVFGKPLEHGKKPCGCSAESYDHPPKKDYPGYPGSGEFHQPKKACEHKKPCSCSVESYEPPKKDYPRFPASGESYHLKKPCEHKKPCSCSAESSPPVFPASGESYHLKKPCEHKKPCSCSAESYELPKKDYPGFPSSGESYHLKKPCDHKKPCSCSVESFVSPKKPYSFPCSHESAGSHDHPKKPYQPYPKEYSSGESYKPDYSTPQVYNAPKKPCGAHPEPPYYKSTTPAPHPTAYPTPRSTAHPVPYRTTCTAGHYTPYTEPPRYPSMSYNSPSYPKPTYEHNRYDRKDCDSPSTYPKPPYHFDQQPRQNY
ncbi:uncharacterized protein LOC131215761 [Anopheles bellator]|uniref:uncharacterized protein LOC131215761 n=1 Tax=Anopheles bellator TaxID=139047 RepID=UPI002647D59D|nr:uncharacterized protein LOC131215761 [Anopheles bellator]